YVAEEDGYAEPVGIKAGTTYRQSSGHVRINNFGACGRGIAASGNMEISNCIYILLCMETVLHEMKMLIIMVIRKH
ncbi:MAG: hypothetical protein IKA37_00020, partial [Spirochaetales bacterium]|nr:hypothetical protein [Spirochaetales bacterium]